MKITPELLAQMGAAPDPQRGGLVLKDASYKLVFLSAADEDGAFDMLVIPLPERGGRQAYRVRELCDIANAAYAAGRFIGREDLRRRFRQLMDVAESDDPLGDEDPPPTGGVPVPDACLRKPGKYIDTRPVP